MHSRFRRNLSRLRVGVTIETSCIRRASELPSGDAVFQLSVFRPGPSRNGGRGRRPPAPSAYPFPLACLGTTGGVPPSSPALTSPDSSRSARFAGRQPFRPPHPPPLPGPVVSLPVFPFSLRRTPGPCAFPLLALLLLQTDSLRVLPRVVPVVRPARARSSTRTGFLDFRSTLIWRPISAIAWLRSSSGTLLRLGISPMAHSHISICSW